MLPSIEQTPADHDDEDNNEIVASMEGSQMERGKPTFSARDSIPRGEKNNR